MNIQTHTVSTAVGKTSHDQVPFLNVNELKEFNSIGYSGRLLNGNKANWSDFLNTLGRGMFSVKQTKFDNGNMEEEYIITQVLPEASNEFIDKATDKIVDELCSQFYIHYQIGDEDCDDNTTEALKDFIKGHLLELIKGE